MNKQLNKLNEETDKITVRLNPQQKLILAIITPIFLFIIFIVFAKLVRAVHDRSSYYFYSDNNSAFDFSYTWWVWLIYCFVVGVIEFKLFDNPKI